MKKLLLLVAGLMTAATLSIAGSNVPNSTNGTNGVKSLQGGKGINNGFYLNLGFAFPSMVVKTNGFTGGGQSLGFQPNLEFGNQWYFVKKDKMGFGIKVSWFQFGYSTYKPAFYTNNSTNVDLRFIKIAPQFTLGLNEDMVIDFTVEVAPTFFIGGNAQTGSTYVYGASGVLFAPGARFRIKKFAVGFDIGFGSLSYRETRDYQYTNQYGTTTKNVESSGKLSVFYPRIYVGFKF